MGYPPITKRKRRRTTVGSIVVPELPWQRLRDIDREAAERVRRERDDPPLTPDEQRELSRWMCEISTCECSECGRVAGELDYCNQVDCNCADPFHCT